MIESISLSKTATYGDQPEVLGPLRRVNFIFGTNGKRYIRISLCAKDEKMKEALERIKKVFEK